MINKITSNKYFKLSIYIITLLIFLILYLYNFKVINQNYFDINKISTIYFIAGFVLIFIFSTMLLLLEKFKNVGLHIKFFLIGLSLGIIYLVTVPFYNSSDEDAHFFRIYEISQGNFITQHDNNIFNTILPSSLDELYQTNKHEFNYLELKNAFTFELNKDITKKYENYRVPSSYSPTLYIPQAIGTFIGDKLNLNVYYIGILARIFGFIGWLFICTIAIKILPIHKMFAMAVLLSPVSLNVATSLSADTYINAFILLFISYIIKLVYDKKMLNYKNYIILGIFMVILSMLKSIVYAPIILLLLVIPKKLFKNTKQYILIITSLMLIFVLSFSLWNSTFVEYQKIYPNENATNNISFIKKNPIEYSIILSHNFVANITNYISNIFVGNEMYQGKLKTYDFISVLYILIILLSIRDENNKFIIRDKIIIILSIIFMVALIITSMYIFNTNHDLAKIVHIIGVQGRYFIPLVLLGIILIRKKIINLDLKENTIINLIYFTNILVYFTIISKFMI